MNVERALRNYLNGTKARMKESEILECANNNGSNAVINVLFKLINESVDSIDESKAVEREVEVLKLMEVILKNKDDINRKIVGRKLFKLYEKLDRIIFEGKNKFHNINKIQSEFNKIRRELEVLVELNEEKDTKQYDFISFLVTETKNLSYLEYAFNKMPSLTNVRDKDEVHLFRNLVLRYLNSVKLNNEEDIFYYYNLITLIQSQGSFQLSEKERKACFEDIYTFINKLSYNKKKAKNNASKLEYVNSLVELIKGQDTRKHSITDVADKYNIHVYFDEDKIENMRLVRTPMEGEMTDREVIDDYTVCIDGNDTVEVDDALSCRKLPNGNYLLGVHIASVLGYFPYESDIVQEAIYRGRSIYLPFKYQDKDNDFHRTIPIFPYEFSADKGSLKEGESRLARSYLFEIDKEGNLVNERFFKSIVKSDKQLTYSGVNEILDNGCEDKELETTIRNLQEVTSLLDKRYKGTVLYDKVKENRDDYSELRVRKTGSENIVYQSMLLTGNRVAEFFARNNYPLLYRVHETNEEDNRKLKDMIDNLNETYSNQQFKNLYQLIEGLYPKGWYAMEGRHEGLDIDHYCHCTSVLRRAADIIIEHALEVCYDKEPTVEEVEQLREEIASKMIEINAREAPTEYFVKEYRKTFRR